MRSSSLKCVLALLFLSAPTFAADTPARPRTLLLLASNLSYEDLRKGGPLPQVRRLAEQGGMALLNTAVAGRATEAAAYLSVGGGDRLAAPDTRIATQVYAPDTETNEGDSARAVYRRRFGAWPPDGAGLVHVGLPGLQNAQPSRARAEQVGALGDALHKAGLRTAVYGDWRASLILMNRQGIVAQGTIGAEPGAKQLARLVARAEVVAITTKSARALNGLAGASLELARTGTNVVVAVPAPPRGPDARWARLGFVAAAGPAFATGTVFSSPTTRTPGLVANVDLAPSLLHWHNTSTAGAGAGKEMTGAHVAEPWTVLAKLDRHVVATKNATVPVLVAYGVFAVGAGSLALLALGLQSRAGCVTARWGLLVAAAPLLAFLPLGVWAPPTAGSYAAALAGTSIAFAGLAAFIGKRLGVSPLGILLSVTAVVVVVDAFWGSPLVSRALISGYFLPGIRFYGIGNEYEGLTVGAALVGPVLLGADRVAWGRNAILIFWVALLAALGVPVWGADAGGVITATVTFTIALLAWQGKGLRARHVVLAFALAGLFVFLFAVLDRARPEEARSHVGAAIALGQTRGVGAVGEIATRKVAMNLGLMRTPGTLAALAGLIPIWWLLSRGPFGARATHALERRPLLRRALPAAAWGALATLVFNDSGIAAALLLLAPPTTALIDAILCDFLRLTTERGVSASPFATN